MVLVAIGYLVGVGVTAAFGSDDPWASGIFGVCPVLVGYFADTLKRRSRNP
ncbi:hypothetical protein [Amycolatopsis sp. cmx-4-68]|uniref:hypothetical protein n=1 Tax=Amycolatopsis sp. cmx-4-68 TaxID=2790938 RepID=UPI003979EC38